MTFGIKLNVKAEEATVGYDNLMGAAPCPLE